MSTQYHATIRTISSNAQALAAFAQGRGAEVVSMDGKEVTVRVGPFSSDAEGPYSLRVAARHHAAGVLHGGQHGHLEVRDVVRADGTVM